MIISGFKKIKFLKCALIGSCCHPEPDHLNKVILPLLQRQPMDFLGNCISVKTARPETLPTPHPKSKTLPHPWPPPRTLHTSKGKSRAPSRQHPPVQEKNPETVFKPRQNTNTLNRVVSKRVGSKLNPKFGRIGPIIIPHGRIGQIWPRKKTLVGTIKIIASVTFGVPRSYRSQVPGIPAWLFEFVC